MTAERPIARGSVAASSPGLEALRLFIRNPSGAVGSLLLVGVGGASILGPALYGIDPYDISGAPFNPPDALYWFGTDFLGRDIFAGVLAGGRTTLAVGGIAAFITVVIGVSIGALGGWARGIVATLALKVTEFFQVLPPLLFAMVIVTLFGVSLPIVAGSIGVVSWTGTARLTRAEILRIRNLDFVKASTTAGGTRSYLLLSVILPNALPPIVVAAALAIGTAILFESGLSFLGLGDPNVMSWGFIIGQNRAYILEAWWTVLGPGAAIFLAVLSVSLIGDGINDALNPRLRER